MIAIYSTAWLAIVAWSVTNWLRAWRRMAAARLLWTCGCVALITHVLLAFHLVHGWDHDSAYRAVASQTKERTGLDWGGGVYVNHAFAAFWLADVVAWWLWPRRYAARPRWLDAGVQFVFLFMFVNATIVFGTQRAAIAGIVVCLAGVVGWWRAWAGSRQPGPSVIARAASSRGSP